MRIITLDASQISQFLFCPVSWKFKNQDLLNIVGANEKALSMGTVMHDLLDRFYKKRAASAPYEKAAQEAAQEFLDGLNKDPDNWKKIPQLGTADVEFVIKRFMMYVFHYAGSGRDFKIATTPDGKPGVELGFAREFRSGKTARGEKYVFIVEGRIDLLVELEMFNGVLGFVDHKTYSRERNLYDYTIQFLTYAWAARARYGIINNIGMQKDGGGDKWFKRDPIKFEPFMLHRWEKQVERVFYSILSGRIEENLKSCAGAFDSNPCQYTKICETESVQLRNNIIKTNYVTGESKWRPW